MQDDCQAVIDSLTWPAESTLRFFAILPATGQSSLTGLFVLLNNGNCAVRGDIFAKVQIWPEAATRLAAWQSRKVQRILRVKIEDPLNGYIEALSAY